MSRESFREYFIKNYDFPVDYYDEIYEFYIEWLSEEELVEFTVKITEYPLNDKKQNHARLLMNNVMRLFSLADDIEQIRPGKDSLRIMFLVICIETIYTITGSKFNKMQMVLDFFEEYAIEEDKELIQDNFKRSLGDKFITPKESIEISIEIFARIIGEVRNVFVHSGDYWGFGLSHEGRTTLRSLLVKEVFGGKELERTYDVSLTYDQFRGVMGRAFTKYIIKFYS